MFGDLLKALELVLQTVRSETGVEKKRRELARELLRIYLEITDLVDRGREILSLLAIRCGSERAGREDRRKTAVQGRTIALLTLQLQAVENLHTLLANSQLGAVLHLQAPVLTKDLHCLVSLKGWRVFITLDELVSDGHSLTTDEWMARLEARMAELGSAVLTDLAGKKMGTMVAGTKELV